MAVKLSNRRDVHKFCRTIQTDGESPFELEISVHSVKSSFRSTDIETVFPVSKMFRHQPMYCVVTMQPSEFLSTEQGEQNSTFSMISTDDRTIGYKDVARERFFYFSRQLHAALLQVMEAHGIAIEQLWFDWTDPATGLAVLGEAGPSVYCESDALEQLEACELTIVSTAGGACRMINHPRWGVNVYPVTCFVSITQFELLEEALSIVLGKQQL